MVADGRQHPETCCKLSYRIQHMPPTNCQYLVPSPSSQIRGSRNQWVEVAVSLSLLHPTTHWRTFFFSFCDLGISEFGSPRAQEREDHVTREHSHNTVKLEAETGPQPFVAPCAAEPKCLERVTGLSRVIDLNYQGETGLLLHSGDKRGLCGSPKAFLGAIVS